MCVETLGIVSTVRFRRTVEAACAVLTGLPPQHHNLKSQTFQITDLTLSILKLICE